MKGSPMSIEKNLVTAQKFFTEHRGRMGLSYGILIGAAMMYWHLKDETNANELELIVTDEDVDRMLEEDELAVFETRRGPIFVAMQKLPTEG
ncbi:membrane protein [Gordonia phage Figliar]|nr:membrane protein [Gordonia phage Figliar]